MCALGLRLNLTNNQHTVAQSFIQAYEETLIKYHAWLIQRLFSMGFELAPNRATFYRNLGGHEDTDEEIINDINQWLPLLQRVVDIINGFVLPP